MEWTKITVFTTAKGIEPVLGILLDLGIDSTEVSDENEFKSFLEENRDAWDYVDDALVENMSKETTVSFYVENGSFDILSALKAELDRLRQQDTGKTFGRLETEISLIEGEDWRNSWKKYFHTFEIGDKLIIKPYWEETENTDKKVFEINPGLSFGTGTHHTTKMCLEDIIEITKENDSVLDLGAGSGILSIVSMLFGADEALAVDIDENAEKTIAENLERNGIDKSKYSILIGNVLTDGDINKRISEKRYDIILANIVADVIIKILPVVKKALKADGRFITSGIIEERISEVKEKLFEAGFEIISEKRSGDWAEFLCRLI